MAQVFRWAVALLALFALVSGVAGLSPVARLQQAAQVPANAEVPTADAVELAVPDFSEAEPEVEQGSHAEQLMSVSVCAQRGGTCKATSGGCSGGSFSAGLCPGASNIQCCLVSNTACSQRGGSCRHTSVGCAGGTFSHGLCPGDADIQCCTASSACSSRGGQCKLTSSGCSGSFQAGLCPGASNNQCCLPAAPSACSSRGGQCKLTSSGCSGSFQAGLCPGASNNQCCLPAANKCSASGGQCKLTSSGCGGYFQPGLCPGASNNQCCLPGGGGACGPYGSAPVESITGNNNQQYGVVRIIPSHLTNPSIYGASPYDEDNTMLKATACAFNAMHDAAKKSGINLTINSGFRTLKRQEYFWYCYQTKRCNNGNIAARPGTSNHGTGLALDINMGGNNYAWLARNAHAFGFVRTVPQETWHWEHRPGAPPAPYT